MAQEPSATGGNIQAAGVSAGLGLDALLRRPTRDDWVLYRKSTYESAGAAQPKQRVALALSLAAAQGNTQGEQGVDTDSDGKADTWVYYENGKPAFVEWDSLETGCHDIRIELGEKGGQITEHRFWFTAPPIPLADQAAPPLKLNELYDWGGLVTGAKPGGKPLPLELAAKEVLPSLTTEAAELAEASPDKAVIKRLSELAAQAKRLRPQFMEVHRREGFDRKLRTPHGFRMEILPYDLDDQEGSEVAVGYAPQGVTQIQFFQKDWREGLTDESRIVSPGLLAEVHFSGDQVDRIEFDQRRYFALSGYWLRASKGAPQHIAKTLLAAGYEAYRVRRWYAAASRFRQASLAAALLGDLEVNERGEPTISFNDKQQQRWAFPVLRFAGQDLLEFARTLAQSQKAEIWSLARTSDVRGNEAEALELYTLAGRFADKQHETLRKVSVLERLSDLHRRLGNYDRSIEHLFTSLDLEATLGYSRDVIRNLPDLSETSDGSDQERVLGMRSHAMAVNRAGKIATISAHLLDLGELDRARSYLAEAERMATTLGNRYLDADLMCLRGKLQLAEGSTELGLARLIRAHETMERETSQQQDDEFGRQLLQRGESRHTFQVDEGRISDRIDMRSLTSPLAYQAFAAGLVAEAHLMRSVELAESNAQQARQHLTEASTWQQKAQQLSHTAKDEDGLLVAELRLAAIASLEGKHDQALAAGQQIAERSRKENRFETLWRALSLVGAAHRGRGEIDEAIAAYEAAAQEVESLRTRLSSEPIRRSFFGSKIEIYEQLAALYLAAPDADKPQRRQQTAERVWLCIERAKARTLLDTLAGEPLRLKGKTVAEAVSKAPLLRQGTSSSPDSTTTSEALAGLDRPELQEVASFSAVQPTSLKAVAAALQPGDLVIEYFVTEDELLAAVISADSIDIVRLPELTSARLPVAVENFRRQIEDRRGIYQPTARKLYEQLIAPCLADQSNIKRICIVPGGILHYLPFAALMQPNDKFLIETYSLFTAPSASALLYAMHRRVAAAADPGGNALIVADPVPHSGYAPLPHAGREGQELWALTHESPPLLQGAAATEGELLAALAQARYFHFAGHTHLLPNAPLRTALMCTEDLDRDGRLEVREILELDLKQCELAVLSACETQLGRWSRGDEIVGLERAFLRAGVPTVVASLWKVDDAATQALMVEFYQNLWVRKQGRLDALRSAQLALLDGRLRPKVDQAMRALGLPQPLPEKGKSASSRHPRYWSAFVLCGDWR